jgi:hypothetical protein
MINPSNMRWTVHVARNGEMNVFRILVLKSGGKRPLGRSGRRWDDIEIDVIETGFESMEWITIA